MTLHRNELKGRRAYAVGAFALLFSLLILAPAACAQAVGSSRGLPGSGGRSIIQGKVIFPADPAPKTKRVKVRLEASEFSGSTAHTDDNGVFLFNGLLSGYYTITVDAGPDYEVAVERVNIERETNAGGRSVNVPIYLKPKGAGAASFAGVPKGAVDQYNKGLEAAKAGDSKRAVELLKAAVEQAPKFGPALNELGVQYLKLGEPDKAAEAFKAALSVTPDEFGPRLNYGIALLNLKKFAEAETEIRVALKKNANASTAHYYLGMALISQQKIGEAQSEFEKSVKGSDQIALAHKYLGGIYWRNKDYKRAADELEKYVKLDPKAPDAEKIRSTVKELREKK
ncbi:MAG TPA: tetratricopeptide repeat protein [Pyrinomonadaceae bacterium]|jgi:tetratricopeptide (TPR) repeat protein